MTGWYKSTRTRVNHIARSMSILLTVSVLVWNIGLASPEQELSRVWAAPKVSAQQRAAAVNRAFTNGTPMSVVISALGTNYTRFSPTSTVWMGPDPEPRKISGLMYRFGEEWVVINTSAGIAEKILAGTFTGAGHIAPAGGSKQTVSTHTLPPWDNGGPRLQIDLPSNFSMRRHKGPDFDVFYFTNGSKRPSLGLYVGHHPSLSTREGGIIDIRRQPGRVGDVSVEWLRWSKDSEQFSEALVRDFFGQSAGEAYANLVLHFFIGGTASDDVARMEAAAATLRLEKAR
jgi:hypothetical protein